MIFFSMDRIEKWYKLSSFNKCKFFFFKFFLEYFVCICWLDVPKLKIYGAACVSFDTHIRSGRRLIKDYLRFAKKLEKM